jgi:transposase-like protein
MKRKGPARDLKKELYWRGILRQHRQSGLTIRDFCRKQGLTESLFYAWRREVKHRRPAKGGRGRDCGRVRRDQPSVGARRRALRQERALPLLTSMKTWLDQQAGNVLPKSPNTSGCNRCCHALIHASASAKETNPRLPPVK